MGAVDVSPEGGFLQRSVFGGAARVNAPNHSGTTSSGILRGVKDSLAGCMAWFCARRARVRYSEICARRSFAFLWNWFSIAYVYVVDLRSSGRMPICVECCLALCDRASKVIRFCGGKQGCCLRPSDFGRMSNYQRSARGIVRSARAEIVKTIAVSTNRIVGLSAPMRRPFVCASAPVM